MDSKIFSVKGGEMKPIQEVLNELENQIDDFLAVKNKDGKIIGKKDLIAIDHNVLKVSTSYLVTAIVIVE